MVYHLDIRLVDETWVARVPELNLEVRASTHDEAAREIVDILLSKLRKES